MKISRFEDNHVEIMASHRKIENIRNIGIMAHIDAGKTTLTERILYYSGVVHRVGEVDDGTATMDWMIQERERGITITSAATTITWKNRELNLIDTPGHVDFTVEVERCLRILDGAVALFCAVGGVEPQSETVWHQADKYLVPRIAFINKLDRVGADFNGVIQEMKKKLGAKPVPIQIPIGAEEFFRGVVDLITMRAQFWKDNEYGKEYEPADIPEGLIPESMRQREYLLENVVEHDEEVLNKYLEGKDITTEELLLVIRKATLSMDICPVLCGSALRNKGVQPLFDAVVNFLPSPIDVPPPVGKDPETDSVIVYQPTLDMPFSGLAFKVMSDPEKPMLTYIRIYSGILKVGQKVFNSNNDSVEKISRIFKMHSNSRKRVEEAFAGEIVAIVGLKNTRTGDTLCNPESRIVFESMMFPEPVISVAIEPKSIMHQDKLEEALHVLSSEDPTFRHITDKETGQTIISGMGELHLDILVDRLLREFKVEAKVGKPQVSYRETISTSVESWGESLRQIGDKRYYAKVLLLIEPNDINTGIKFENTVPETKINANLVKNVHDSIKDSLASGIQLGYPIIDIKVTLLDGEYDADDPSGADIKIAASKAFHQGCQKAKPILLEPIMNVEIITPKEHVGETINNLNLKKGIVEEIQHKKTIQVIHAVVPLKQMFGYATELRSITQGRGTYTMKLSHYQHVQTE